LLLRLEEAVPVKEEAEEAAGAEEGEAAEAEAELAWCLPA
jgi:hypothetical protein